VLNGVDDQQPTNQKELSEMVKYIVRFMREEEGATAPEYGLMVALIAVVIIASVTLLGTNLTATFTQVSGAIGAAS
jgi:pilus assembly protein Flp/PilA